MKKKSSVLFSLFTQATDDIVKIEGFAQHSAEVIVEGLANIKQEFFKVYGLGFNLVNTPKVIAGHRVGVTKINAAKDKGVRVLTEQEYLKLLEKLTSS